MARLAPSSRAAACLAVAAAFAGRLPAPARAGAALPGRGLAGHFATMDLGVDGLGCGCSSRVRKTWERKLDPAPHRVEGLHHEGPFLAFAEHLARRTRRLVAHARQRQIATRAIRRK